MVVQDMLRVFIIRVATQRAECAVVLLQPMISWIDNHVDETSPSEMDIFKVKLQFYFILIDQEIQQFVLIYCSGISVASFHC